MTMHKKTLQMEDLLVELGENAIFKYIDLEINRSETHILCNVKMATLPLVQDKAIVPL